MTGDRVSRKRRAAHAVLRRLPLFGTLIGLGLAVWLVATNDLAAVAAAFGRIGVAGFAGVTLVRILVILLCGIAWARILDGLAPATAPACLILRFVRELAEFEREADAVKATEEDFRRDGWGPQPVFEALIAELDGAPVGFALAFRNFSTWEGRPGLYVEDLYVTPDARRYGVGRKLLAAVAKSAVERGYRRVDLSVLDWNPARGFYDRVGFRQMKEWLPYRLTGDALSDLAAEVGAEEE